MDFTTTITKSLNICSCSRPNVGYGANYRGTVGCFLCISRLLKMFTQPKSSVSGEFISKMIEHFNQEVIISQTESEKQGPYVLEIYV